MSLTHWLKKSKSRGTLSARRGMRLQMLELEDRVTPASLSSAQVQQNYGQIPLSFEANVGQTASQVQYLTRGSGYALFLTAEGSVLSLTKPTGKSVDGSTGGAGVTISMNLVGSNTNAQVVGQDQLSGTSNYFTGNDPSQWQTNVANFGRVAYRGVYDGVDLVYYGNQRQLEYDFVLAPGADPSNIRFAVAGADSLSLDKDGNLVLHSTAGDVIEHAPVIYQTIDGVHQEIAGEFVLLGNDQVGFKIGNYDHSLPLTIDPTLVYSTYLGGTGQDYGMSIAMDSSGNVYVTGNTRSTNFPTTAGAFKTTFGGNNDTFVTKLNATGTALIYSTYLGGTGDDFVYGIASDVSGNAYITGYTTSGNYPTTSGSFQTAFGGINDAFVTKLNATGTALVYSTYLGGNRYDYGYGIAVDGTGNAYVTGNTQFNNFPVTAGAAQPTNVGGFGAFVTKFNAAGTALIYSTYLGGNNDSQGDAIALDSSGNAYITGFTSSTNFPLSSGAFQTTIASVNDVFVTKLNAAGTAFVYSTYLGGNGQDYSSSIAVDTSGNAYVTGYTNGSNFPTTAGAFQTIHATVNDAFVTKLNSTGTALIYSTYLGGNNTDEGNGIAVDGSGNAYVTGITLSSNFPTTAGAYQSTQGIAYDAFLTKLNATGTALNYSTYFGGNNTDEGQGIALDGSGNAYIIGLTDSTNLPTTSGAFRTNSGGGQDAFVVKFTFAPLPTSVSPISATEYGSSFTLTVNGSNFDSTATVQWNGTPLAVTARTGTTQIQATVPASFLTSVTPVLITVTNPGPFVSVGVPFSINKASSSTTVADNGGTFNGNPFPATSVQATGAGGLNDTNFADFTFLYQGTGSTIYSSANAPTNVGAYTVTATYLGDANHNGSSSNAVPFTISKSGSTTTVVDAGGTFNGNPFPATSVQATGAGGLNDTNFADFTFQYQGTGSTIYNSANAPVNAGAYTVTATYLGDANHNGSSSNAVPFTISKSGSTTTVVDAGGTFNGNPFPATSVQATGAGGLNDTNFADFTFQYQGTGSTIYNSANAPVNAGAYTVTSTYLGDANHNGSSSIAVPFTIAKALSTTTVADAGGTFNGNPFPATSVQASGVSGLNDTNFAHFTFLYQGTGSTIYSSANAPTNAGAYTVTATYLGDANHNGSSSNAVPFTIAKAGSTTTVTISGGAYTGSPFLVTSVRATGVGGLNDTNSAHFTFSYQGTGYGPSSSAPILAGDYSVTATYLGDANHNGSSSSAAAFTIGPRLIALSRTNGSTINFIDWLSPTGATLWSIPVPTVGGANTFGAPAVAAVTDRNGDGYADLFIGSQSGFANALGLVDGKTGALLWSTNPFVATFKGGVNVAVGDITGDGRPEVVVAPASSGGPTVRAFQQNATAPGTYSFTMIRDFSAYAAGYTSGVNVAVADVNTDGLGDIVTGTVASSDDVRVFSGGSGMIMDFLAFNKTGVIPGYTGGVTVAAGDFDGDGYADIITGTQTTYSRVRVYSGKGGSGLNPGAVLQDFKTSNQAVGVLVMAADFGNGKTEIGTLTQIDVSVLFNIDGYNSASLSAPSSLLSKAYARPSLYNPPIREG